MSKKAKRRVIPLDELRGQLAESATEGTDLACALIAGAHIENATGNLLAKVLVPGTASDGLLNNPLGILSTAGGRADMCYSLGLIDKTTYDNAKQIAKIRNQFAHSHTPVGFDDREVTKLCNSLTAPPLVDKDDKPISAERSKVLLDKPRQRFVMAALGAFVYVSVACIYSKGRDPIDHKVRCLVSEDTTSVVGSMIFFNE